MRRFCELFFAAFALFVAGCSSHADAPVEILYADGGAVTVTAEGKYRLASDDVVPLIAGQKYAWRMYVRTNKQKIKIIEEITLSAPTSWSGSANMKISSEGKTATVEREVDSSSGLIAGFWGVNGDDPAGAVKISVTIEGKVRQTFGYVLKKP